MSPSSGPRPPGLWIDVEDLFQYAAANTRPSGIQRVVFELCRALHAHPDAAARIGFLRHDPVQDGFVSVPFDAIDALHRRLTQARAAPPAARPEDRDRSAEGAANPGRLRSLAYRLPLELRTPAVSLLKAQRDGARAFLELAGETGRQGARIVSGAARRRRSSAPDEIAGKADRGSARETAGTRSFGRDAAPGDVLLVLGSTWFHPFYARVLGRACAERQLRSAVLFYDAIPLIRPEWCRRNLVARFRHWAETLLPITDIPLSISEATGRDIAAFAAREGLPLRRVPISIPMGTGFSRPPTAPAASAGPDRVPPAGSFVLIVSTIEARKNHALLFRVWRRLLDEMPAEEVPTLVFAGGIGWLVEDLLQQLRNTDWLGGKIVMVDNPDDHELERLYRGCRFTLFPSFYEGWGLPVTESLGFGRPCLASSSSALPEAGGTLARYFDPEDGNEAFRVIRHAIEDRAGTENWATEVRNGFRSVGWDETVRVLLEAIDRA